MNPFQKNYPKLGAILNPGMGGMAPPAAPGMGAPGMGAAAPMPAMMPKGLPAAQMPGVKNPGALEGYLKKRRGA